MKFKNMSKVVEIQHDGETVPVLVYFEPDGDEAEATMHFIIWPDTTDTVVLMDAEVTIRGGGLDTAFERAGQDVVKAIFFTTFLPVLEAIEAES